MKTVFLLSIALMPVFSSGQMTGKHSVLKDRLAITLSEGVLNIIPLSDKAIRVQWKKDSLQEERELVFIDPQPVPAFRFTETTTKLTVTTKGIKALIDKQTGAITFTDHTGKVFLREKPGSRKLLPSQVMGQPCFVAEQSFDSPEDEYLFGLGQFQDGHYNLRNISRKLHQVNSQISIPFVYSSRGYGILWHQYGLTQFNPADQPVHLTKAGDQHPATKAKRKSPPQQARSAYRSNSPCIPAGSASRKQENMF